MARSRPLINSMTVTETQSSEQKRYEYSNGLVIYAGTAPRGIASTDDGWQIIQFTYDGSSQCTLQQTANGAWSDRANLDYA